MDVMVQAIRRLQDHIPIVPVETHEACFCHCYLESGHISGAALKQR